MNQDVLNSRIDRLEKFLDQGKLHINDASTIESLMNVRLLPDNVNVNPETVDGRVRALALAVEMMEHEEELLSIPLLETQKAYFKVLDSFFGTVFNQMMEKGLNPHQVATVISKNKKIVHSFIEDHEALQEGLHELWQYYLPIIQAHLRRLKGVISVFGGDIFPSYSGSIARSAGLYVDTILVPDPMLRTTSFFKQMSPDKALYYLAKHALNALQYKELALAELDSPIIVFVPDETYLGENDFDLLDKQSQSDILEHLKEMFRVNFTDMDEADSFLQDLETTEDLFQKLVNEERMLFDTEWEHLTKTEQFVKWNRENSWAFNNIPGGGSIGFKVKFMVQSRMMQSKDIVNRALQYNGIPIVNAPTSWQYLLWSYQYSSNTPNSSSQVKNMLISNSLTKINYDIIGNLSDTALIKLRQENVLNELRELLSKGIEEISTADNTSFDEVTTSVFTNIQESFSKHEEEVQELKSRNKRFWGLNLTNSIVTVGLDIAAAATGNTKLGTISAALTGILGAPSFKEIFTDGGKLLEQNKKIKNSAVGILYSNQNR
ncbi:hypothetical protein [Paenibacillus sp. OV219]|uniref:hypothetical protein n=1 Tax=Paenibacillus sp. OV219 TaxID=1884377 RepID=UPI0008AD5673|nr:hypothetical protein [Paenibacillus sp. OV219]SEM81068.1 hypothetical protein SAMN05518847_101863 [Paenibacillus sp. OV219]